MSRFSQAESGDQDRFLPYTVPRMEDCLDRIGKAKHISQFDLLKGYWQVLLTERASEVSYIVTLGKTYRCKVMPFGMKNAPATFQKLMNLVTDGLEGCVVYLDDVLVFSDTWKDHLKHVRDFLVRLLTANLVANLSKCEFGKNKVQYLGYDIGDGQLLPSLSKVQVISDLPSPRLRKELQRF